MKIQLKLRVGKFDAQSIVEIAKNPKHNQLSTEVAERLIKQNKAIEIKTKKKGEQ